MPPNFPELRWGALCCTRPASGVVLPPPPSFSRASCEICANGAIQSFIGDCVPGDKDGRTFSTRRARRTLRCSILGRVTPHGTASAAGVVCPYGKTKESKGERTKMFVGIALILGILWGLGLWSGHTLGGAVHVLLLAGAVMMVLALRQWWRRPA